MTDRIHAPGVEERADSPDRDRSFFEAMLANAGDVMTVLDENGVITYHSAAIKEMLGVEPETAVGFFAGDIVHRDDQERVSARIRACIADRGSHLTDIFRLAHIDGTWRWVEADVRNLLDDPSIRGILVVSRDITARRKLEQHFSIAETTAGFGTYRWEKGSEAPSISSATARLLDLTDGVPHLSVADLFELIHPDDADRVRETFSGLSENPAPFSFSTRIRQQDGSYRHFISHGFPEIDGNGELTSVMGVIDDVTESLNTELELKRSETQYRLIAEHTHDMFARHAPDGTLTFVSPAVKKVLGFEPELMIGQDIIQHMHPEDQPAARAEVEKLGVSRDSIRLTFRLKHIEGHYLWFESTIHPIYDDETGEIAESIAITRDISERKEYEQKLLDARERAETANRSKSTFLANMSHELRTPLNAIIGFSEILKREMYGPLGNENYSDYAALIYDSGSHLLDLISDILDMSKIEAGKMDIALGPIDIHDIAKTCLRLVEPKSGDKNQELILNIDESVGSETVIGDLRATKQIMLNLLSNAVKFTGDGGTIRVDIRSLEDEVEISVTDNGIGIAQDDIPRILQPFEQVTGESSLAEEGSGLGLALTKSFCELRGGSFSLESEEGVGTCARVTLPKINSEKLKAVAAG